MFSRVTKIFERNDFIRNSLSLTIGTTVAQLFPLLIYPILGRIYNPQQFGLLASITAIVSILSVCSTGKYEMSILIAEKDSDAANITLLSLLLSIIFLTISLVPLYICREVFLGANESELNSSWILVCPFSAFCIAVFTCYNEWCVRKKYYKRLSINKITNSISISSGKLLCGFLNFTSNGLIIGDLLGRFLTAIACVIRIIKKDFNIFKSISYRGMVSQAKRFIEFPKFTMPAQLLNALGMSLPVLLIGRYYNAEELGYYSMASNVLALPINVISLSIRDVFRQKANEKYKEQGSFRSIFIRTFRVVSIVAISGATTIYYFLPKIFEVILGADWTKAGYYTQIMLPMIVVDFIAMSLSGVLTITEKLKQSLYWQIYYVSVSILSIFVGGIFFEEIESTLVLFTISRLSAYIYLLIISYYYSGKHGKN